MNFCAKNYNRIWKWDFHQFWREKSNIWNIGRSPNVGKNVCKTIAFGWPAKTQIFTFAGKPNETFSLTFWPFFDRKKIFWKIMLFGRFYTNVNLLLAKNFILAQVSSHKHQMRWTCQAPKVKAIFRPFWGKTQLSMFMQSHY